MKEIYNLYQSYKIEALFLRLTETEHYTKQFYFLHKFKKNLLFGVILLEQLTLKDLKLDCYLPCKICLKYLQIILNRSFGEMKSFSLKGKVLIFHFYPADMNNHVWGKMPTFPSQIYYYL